MPLNETALAPVRLEPVIVTVPPTGPLAGAKDAMLGGTTTAKLAALVAVPPGVTTEIGPLVAPAGTVVVICVAESTVKLEAVVPLNETEVAPVRLPPAIVTVLPTGPLVGENELIDGPVETVTFADDVAELRTASSARAATVYVPPAVGVQSSR
jgi:hypothetical protein